MSFGDLRSHDQQDTIGTATQVQCYEIVNSDKKDTGLSVALLISVLMIFLTNSIVSLTIPWTCKI